jgi:hypothetical protein
MKHAMTLQEAQNICFKNGYYGSYYGSGYTFRNAIENYCKQKLLRDSNNELEKAIFRIKQEISNPKSKFGKK